MYQRMVHELGKVDVDEEVVVDGTQVVDMSNINDFFACTDVLLFSSSSSDELTVTNPFVAFNVKKCHKIQTMTN